MSTISFPHPHSPSSNDHLGFGSNPRKRSSSLDESVDENGVLVGRGSANGSSHNDEGHSNHRHSLSGSGIAFYPPSYDPSASTSSFQMNPLSMHPPRTPRTSIMGGTNQGNNMSMSMMSLGVGMGASSHFGYASVPAAFGVGFGGSASSAGNGNGMGQVGIGSEVTREKGGPDFADDHDDDDDVDQEELEQRAGKRVRKEEVWREMLATSVGRDKTLVGMLSDTLRFG